MDLKTAGEKSFARQHNRDHAIPQASMQVKRCLNRRFEEWTQYPC